MERQNSSESASPRVQDENLRLILSTEQEQWIKQQIGMAAGLAWASVFFLMLGAGWLTAVFSGAFFDHASKSCFELAVDTPNYQKVIEEFRAQGLSPCPAAGDASEEFTWRDLIWLPTLIAMIILVISPLTLGRNLYLLRRYKGYLTDHDAFLRKYNRP